MTRQVGEGAHPLREPGARPSRCCDDGDQRRVGALSTSCGHLLGDEQRGAGAGERDGDGGDRARGRAPRRARRAPLQSVTIATNGGATCVRLLGCERPRKYVSETAPKRAHGDQRHDRRGARELAAARARTIAQTAISEAT